MSLLSPHFMKTKSLTQWLGAGPRVLKFTPPVFGAVDVVPPGPLCVGKLDQDAGGARNWKAQRNAGLTPEDAAATRFILMKPELTLHQRYDAVEADNEVVPDTVQEAQWYAAYNVSLMQRLDGIGVKLVMFNFATGTPEFWVWPHLLPALSHATQHGHYLGLHEYMAYDPSLGVGSNQPGGGFFGVEGDEDFGWSALRYRAVYRNVLEPAGLGGLQLIITECGHDIISFSPPGMPTGSWTAMGLTPAQYMANLAWYDERLREDVARGRRIVGATVFTSGATPMWQDYDITGDVENMLVNYVADPNNATPDPPVAPPTAPPVTPPVNPPTVPAVNLLANPSFEDGWSDPDGETQEPHGWTVAWNTGGAYNVMKGEAVHKSDAMFPPEERGIFILDGEWCYKVFGGRKNIWFRIKQTLNLPAGRYRLSTPIWVDCYRWDKINRVKDYNLEPNHAQFLLKVNGDGIGGWRWLPTGGLQRVVTEFEHDGGECMLAIHLRTEYAEENNFFLDGFGLEKVTQPVAPPVTPPVTPPANVYKSTIVMLPHALPAARVQHIVNVLLQKERTFMWSHDDARWVTIMSGHPDSIVEVVDPESQRSKTAALEAWGVPWREWVDPSAPVALPWPTFEYYPVRHRFHITQAFGARPEYYAQFGFPGGHEGLDLEAYLGDPVVAVFDGTITRVDTVGNYGNRLDLTSKDGKWIAAYAHLQRFAGGIVGGRVVKAGDVIGYAGTTGNSSGVHLHLTLKHTSLSYTNAAGYTWPFNIFDPTHSIMEVVGNTIDPPLADGIDLKDFKVADPTAWRVVKANIGGNEQNEDVQDMLLNMRDGIQVFVRRKGSNGEWHGYDSNYFYLFHDTSPDVDPEEGVARVYTLYKGLRAGAAKSMRRQTIGERWIEQGTHRVQFRAKNDCRNLAANSGEARNQSRIVRYEKNYTFNGYGQNLRFDEVLWEETGVETQIYGRLNGKSVGWIGWKAPWGESEPVAVYFDRPPMTQEPNKYCDF